MPVRQYSAGSLPLMLRPLVAVPAAVYAAFLVLVVAVAAPHARRLFTPRYGRRHRLAGLAYVTALGAGACEIPLRNLSLPAFDAILGVLGVTLTLTAAFDFKAAHQRVKNVASGPLGQDSTVSFDEMLEHSFYQVRDTEHRTPTHRPPSAHRQALNLCQALYLHAVGATASFFPLDSGAAAAARSLLACLVAAPWLLRARFPVNSFSANYAAAQGKDPFTRENLMYRVKKYQYLLYKHCLLHGLNISVALSGEAVAGSRHFRLYWVCLNTAYTMEFFLQTLVRRRHLSQWAMLALNQLLMAVSTVAALQVLQHVTPWVAVVSLLLNFSNRHHDCANSVALLAAAGAVRWYFRGSLPPPL